MTLLMAVLISCYGVLAWVSSWFLIGYKGPLAKRYAHFLAQTYYEQDRADEADPAERSRSKLAPEEPQIRLPSHGSVAEEAAPTDVSPVRAWDYLRFTESLADPEGAQPCSPTEAARARAKGFGLSKGQLQAAGLSATGHALLNQSRPLELELKGPFERSFQAFWEAFSAIFLEEMAFPRGLRILKTVTWSENRSQWSH